MHGSSPTETQGSTFAPPEPDRVRRARELADEGRYRTALAELGGSDAVRAWPRALHDADALLLGLRLSHWLGGDELATAFDLALARRFPHSASGLRSRIRLGFAFRGPLETLTFLEASARPDEPEPVALERTMGRAHAYAALRDFDRAFELVDRVAAAGADPARTAVDRARILEGRDRRDEALALLAKVVEDHPLHVAAHLALSRLLADSGSLDQAVASLRAVEETLESAEVPASLAVLHLERRDFRAEAESLDRFEAAALLAGDRARAWLAARRSDNAYARGDRTKALGYARLATTSPFHTKLLVPRLEDRSRPEGRTLLSLPHVRQDHRTCGPATLVSIATHLGRSFGQNEVVSAIWDGGTTNANERRWAEEQGFVARNFRVTEESARACLDAGFPFALQTVAPGSAHQQAVVGYDRLRGTLYVREPSSYVVLEYDAIPLLESSASAGPVGLLIVRPEDAARADALGLPDVSLYDRGYEAHRAMDRSDRATAERLHASLVAEAPDHPITLEIGNRLLAMRRSWHGLLASLEHARALFPADRSLDEQRIRYSRGAAPRARYWSDLERLATEAPTGPFATHLASELFDVDRETARARRILRRVLAANPTEAEALAVRSRMHAFEGEHERAYALARFASCASEWREDLAWNAFAAAAPAGATEDALAMLDRRAVRALPIHGRATITHVEAALRIGRFDVARSSLERALEARPDDVELGARAAEAFEKLGEKARADALLARDGIAEHAPIVERARLHVATRRGDAEARRRSVDALLALDPLDTEALRHAFDLDRREKGYDEARAALAAIVERDDAPPDVQRLFFELTANERSEGRLAALRRYVETFPGDGWGLRELAYEVRDRGLLDEARSLLEDAKKEEPWVAATLLLEANLVEGTEPEAAARSRQRVVAVEAEPHPSAFEGLVGPGMSPDEACRILEATFERLVARATTGASIPGFVDFARGFLGLPRMLERLGEAERARPDLPGIAIQRIDLLLALGDDATAREVAAELVERHPASVAAWSARARAHASLPEKARSDIEHALGLDPSSPALHMAHLEVTERSRLPSWYLPAHELAKLHVPTYTPRLVARARLEAGEGRAEVAEEVLRQALSMNPFDVDARDFLAYLLAQRKDFDGARKVLDAPSMAPESSLYLRGRSIWLRHQEGRPIEAIAEMRALVEANPRYGWGLETLLGWAAEARDPETEILAARMLIALAPKRLASVRSLAAALHYAGELDEALPTYRAALALDPSDPGSCEGLVRAHLERGEAEAARDALHAHGERLETNKRAFLGLRTDLALGDERGIEQQLRTLFANGTQPVTQPAHALALASGHGELAFRTMEAVAIDGQGSESLGRAVLRARRLRGLPALRDELWRERQRVSASIRGWFAAHVQGLGALLATLFVLRFRDRIRRSDEAFAGTLSGLAPRYGLAGFLLVLGDGALRRLGIEAPSPLASASYRQLGSYFLARRDLGSALEAFRRSVLDPDRSCDLAEAYAFAAFERVTSGDVDAARPLLEAVVERGLGPLATEALATTRELVRVLSLPSPVPSDAIAQARAAVDEAYVRLSRGGHGQLLPLAFRRRAALGLSRRFRGTRLRIWTWGFELAAASILLFFLAAAWLGAHP